MANRELTAPAFEQLLQMFRRYYQQFDAIHMQAFPQIAHLLKVLAERKIDCFVASSKRTDVLKRNIASLGFTDYFKEILGADKVAPHYKLHPASIEYLVARYHLNKQQTLMVGDATFDIQMGNAAGVKTCAVTWGTHSDEKLRDAQPTFVITAPLALLEIVGTPKK